MTEVQHNLAIKPGVLSGTGVIRDKDGNVKGEFTFGGEATMEQAQGLAESLNVPLEVKGPPVANPLGTRVIPKP